MPGMHMQKIFRSPNPTLNNCRHPEPVCTDTIYADTPSIPWGYKCAQLYVGRNSHVKDLYGCKTDKQFINTLEDVVHKRGVMDEIISDRAQAEVSDRVKDYLRGMVIQHWTSEPYMHHQNFGEHEYRDVKANTNKVMNMSGTPASAWFLAMLYV